MPMFEWIQGEQEHYRRLFRILADHWDEKATRLLGAAMAWSLGEGSHTAIHAITGLAMDTLQRGVAQLQGDAALPADRIRRPGGGRKPITGQLSRSGPRIAHTGRRGYPERSGVPFALDHQELEPFSRRAHPARPAGEYDNGLPSVGRGGLLHASEP